jgi:hypothetical protein
MCGETGRINKIEPSYFNCIGIATGPTCDIKYRSHPDLQPSSGLCRVISVVCLLLLLLAVDEHEHEVCRIKSVSKYTYTSGVRSHNSVQAVLIGMFIFLNTLWIMTAFHYSLILLNNTKAKYCLLPPNISVDVYWNMVGFFILFVSS